MSFTHLLWVAGFCGFIVWLSRKTALAGWRLMAVVLCRVLSILAVSWALWAIPKPRIQHIPRQVVYVVDESSSMDATQRRWISRRIASLEGVRPQNTSRAVIAFGATAQTVVAPGRDRLSDPESLERLLSTAAVNRKETSLEAGLLEAATTLPSASGSIVLFSDGRETSGDIRSVLPYLRRIGWPVFPEPVPVTQGRAATLWDQMVAPPVIRQGSPVAVSCVVFGGTTHPQRGELVFSLQGVPVKRQPVIVNPGWQVLTVSVPAIGRGTMAFGVTLNISSEKFSEQKLGYTEVEGPPQLLFVTDEVAALPALAASLKQKEIAIEVIRPQELPGDMEKLSGYDAVLLFNAPKSQISAEQASALRAYVESYGGGLLTVGLGGDLAQELAHPAPLDSLLPVSFEPKGLKESKRRVCMVMLIDRSASMLGPRMAATKRAAIELVKQLSPEDLVGIFAFDTQPYVVAEVQPASQVTSWIVEKLVTLRSSGGTDIFPALTTASNRLDLTGATIKHIVLLSDGNTPFHEQAYTALVKKFKLDGITVSTIGVGSAFINTDYMQWLAGSTGGTFYTLDNLNDLPRLIAQDTEKTLSRLPFAEGSFRPKRSPAGEWFAEVSDWPVLRGYLTATAKSSAQVDLTVNGGEGDDPLLARWAVGKGRVASFTSDASPRWSPDWIRWEGFQPTWAQIIHWVMRPRISEEVFVWVDERQGIQQLMVEAGLEDPHGQLISADGNTRIPIPLIKAGSATWSASLEHISSGWYQLNLESTQQKIPVSVKRWVQVGNVSTTQEIPGQPPRQEMLEQIAHGSGGSYAIADRAFVPPTIAATVFEPIGVWWLPLTIILLLVDVTLRGSSML